MPLTAGSSRSPDQRRRCLRRVIRRQLKNLLLHPVLGRWILGSTESPDIVAAKRHDRRARATQAAPGARIHRLVTSRITLNCSRRSGFASNGRPIATRSHCACSAPSISLRFWKPPLAITGRPTCCLNFAANAAFAAASNFQPMPRIPPRQNIDGRGANPRLGAQVPGSVGEYPDFFQRIAVRRTPFWIDEPEAAVDMQIIDAQLLQLAPVHELFSSSVLPIHQLRSGNTGGRRKVHQGRQLKSCADRRTPKRKSWPTSSLPLARFHAAAGSDSIGIRTPRRAKAISYQ